MTPATWLVIAAAAAGAAGAAGYLASLFNGLVEARNNVDKAWSNIDVLLRQRHDELPMLVDACRGYMTHERDTLESVTRLRGAYARARTTRDLVHTENELNRHVHTLQAAVEAYPALKSSGLVLQVQQRISAIESAIADRREYFNDSVNIYNTQMQRFPERLMAAALGYRPHTELI